MKGKKVSHRLWFVACATVLAFGPAAAAENWPGWRGPTGVGISGEKDLPLTWDAKKKENILWYKEIKGNGHSSPIVWQDRVFVTTSMNAKDPKTQPPSNFVVCYQASDGEELWRTLIPPGEWPVNKGGDAAIPTPVTDGKMVFARFGTSDINVIAAVDFKGKVVWRKERLGPFNLNPGLCSSLVLYKDAVLQLCDQGGGKGFLQALDKKTGDVKWEQPRKTESNNNATPILISLKGRTDLVVNASNALQGLDPANGKLVWWCKAPVGFGTSPAFGSGLVYAENGAGGSPGVCVDPTGKGDVTKSHVKWQIDKTIGSYASPIIVGGYVYRAHKPDILKCWELATGELMYSSRLKGLSHLSSPFATADGRVYFASGGKTFVILAGPKLKVLATNSLEGLTGDNGPSAAVSGGRIYLKSTNRLVCIGKK
jgi:outer membrane protein assembly factor BamB